jgi:chromosome partitioning protein
MRSIAIVNQKGGVGKTTTAVNLGAALAAAGKQVGLVDLDPQAHASLHLGVSPENGNDSVYGVLIDGRPLAGVRRQLSDRLWLVPSHIDLAAAEVELAGEVGREVILRDKLTEDPAPFDYLIVDCPPSLGLLAINALTAVREVFLPLQPHFLALHGLSKLLRTIDVVTRRLNPRLHLSGVVLCMYDTGTRLAAEVAGDVTEFFAGEHQPGCPWSDVRIFQTRIRRNIRLAEAPSFGQSIFDYAPNSHGAEDYGALAAEVLNQSASDNAEQFKAVSQRA